ncbi:MAG: hypothetical protein RI897_3760, partial [Verrucomicrobiota bacterium]
MGVVVDAGVVWRPAKKAWRKGVTGEASEKS